MGGYYTSPYKALISDPGLDLTRSADFTASNSSPALIICDDFLTDVNTGLIWQATVTNMSALTGLDTPLGSLKFDTSGLSASEEAALQQKNYMAVAWLAEQLIDVNQNTAAGQQEAGELSYAIWGIFDPNALSDISGTDLSAADTDITDAFDETLADTPSDFSNVNIYTPYPGKDESQEYLVVSPAPPVPEPGTLGLLGLGVASFGLVSRRRRKAE